MSLRLLEGIGLTKKEIDIYETLLKNGETLPGVLIKQTGLKRATVYKALYALEEKGLVIQRKVDGKATFVPEPPDRLIGKLEEKVCMEKKMLEDLKVLLPDLKNTFIFSTEKPIMKTFTGVEGLQEIYLDTLNSPDEICWWHGATPEDAVKDKDLKWLLEEYTNERVKRNIHARTLIASAKWVDTHIEQNVELYREIAVVPGEYFPFPYQVCLYGDKVAFMDYKADGVCVGVMIEYPLIARILHSLFNLAWASVKIAFPQK